MSTGISTYTPIPNRNELTDTLFQTLLQVLQDTEVSNNNKVVLLKSKLCSFGKSENNLKIMV